MSVVLCAGRLFLAADKTQRHNGAPAVQMGTRGREIFIAVIYDDDDDDDHDDDDHCPNVDKGRYL